MLGLVFHPSQERAENEEIQDFRDAEGDIDTLLDLDEEVDPPIEEADDLLVGVEEDVADAEDEEDVEEEDVSVGGPGREATLGVTELLALEDADEPAELLATIVNV